MVPATPVLGQPIWAMAVSWEHYISSYMGRQIYLLIEKSSEGLNLQIYGPGLQD